MRGKRFFPPKHPEWLWEPPSHCWYWGLSGGGGGGGVKLTSHPNLLQRLRISGASYTTNSPHSFMACTGTALPEFSNTDSTAKLTYFQWEMVQSLWLVRKRPWSILKYCSSICLNVFKKIRKMLLECFSLWVIFDHTSSMESNSTVVNAIVSWIAYELWNSHEQTHFVHF
jgi:hypothetical protein